MKFQHYQKRVEESNEFKSFIKKHPKAYLCAGFFVLDFEQANHAHQIDYSLPNGKIATFILDDGIKMKISEQAVKKELPKIQAVPKTDIDALQGIVEDEMKNKIVTEKIRKMIAILHIVDNKLIWNLQCILDGLGILQVHVDDANQSVLKFEKHSIMELVKMIPSPNQMNAVKQAKSAKLIPKLDLSEIKEETKEEAEETEQDEEAPVEKQKQAEKKTEGKIKEKPKEKLEEKPKGKK